jgi:hypothetical protein
VSIFDGDDTAFGGWDNDRIYGGYEKDRLSGDDGGDTIWGDDGNDTLNGDNGNDYLDGGADDDVLNGGNDTMNGGAGDDAIRGGTGTFCVTNGDRAARRFRIGADPQAMAHELGLGGHLAKTEQAVPAVKNIGLKARLLKRQSEKRLRSVPTPALLCMRDGTFAVFATRLPPRGVCINA